MAVQPSHARRRLGVELRRLRTEAALTVDQVVRRLEWSRTKLIRIESAKVSLTRHDLLRLCHLYDADKDEVRRVEGWLEETNSFRWWQAYSHVMTATLEEFIALESQAARIHTANSGVFPGLLQAPEYARSVFDAGPHVPDPDAADALVELRVRRQRILDEEDVEIVATIGAGLLYAEVGGPDVLREQLRHLTAVMDRPNVEVRVIPFSAQRAVLTGGIVLFDFPEDVDPSVVYTEYEAGMDAKDSVLDVRRFRRLLNHLRSSALSPEDTRKCIATRLEDL
ncbi:helix-turn-helix domain-containing protein [Embleya sp. NBC_00896]|uniref:helix-turn-helix domain-containing protein n=1 Tax=Embleya sp. NBC_00896 TaxID=2975961 RepID=UPI003868FFF6|nr:helix-turn-helix domain-containing protein [Embleya sp. NBC_00896]